MVASLPPSVTNSSVLAVTQSVVFIRESGVEVEGMLEVVELRLSA